MKQCATLLLALALPAALLAALPRAASAQVPATILPSFSTTLTAADLTSQNSETIFAHNASTSALYGIGTLGLSTDPDGTDVDFEVGNFSLSSGDPNYPITTAVDFNALALQVNFADGTHTSVTLTPDGTTPTTTSDPNTSPFLISLPASLVDGASSPAISAVLTGTFSPTAVQVQVFPLGAAPEPASPALLATGLLSAGIVARRRRSDA